MTLQKQGVAINFSQGMDTKTDPKQVTLGKFLNLENSVFDKAGLLQKRNGFGYITSLPDSSCTAITTYNGNLIATGSSLYAYSADTAQWNNKGPLNPISLSTQPLVRGSTAQSTVDIAITDNMVICTVWVDSGGNNYYQIIDSNNGNILVNKTQLPTGSQFPRIFLIGNNFIITFMITITATPHLQYIAIPTQNLNSPGAAVDISTQLFSITTAYDGQVINNALYIAWNASDGGGAVRATYLDSTLNLHPNKVFAPFTAASISVCGDTSGSSPIIWISFVSTAGNGYTTANSLQLATILAPTAILTTTPVVNITSTAINNKVTIFYEISNTYSYNSIRTDFISSLTCTSAGATTAGVVLLRSVGLGSKAFLYNSTAYLLSAYQSAFQSGYFLIDQNANIIAKLSYSNGGGYPSTQILSNAIMNGNEVSIGSLFKDQIIAVNKSQQVASVGGVYGQLGINLASLTFKSGVQSVEIGSALHLNGGYLRMFDGVKPVEHNFHVFPEDLGFSSATTGGGLNAQLYYAQATYEWTDAQGNIHVSAPSIALKADLTGQSGTAVTFTSTFASGATTITVSSIAGLHVGQVITDVTTGANLTAGTKITAINGSVLTLSLPTAGASGSPDTLQTKDAFAITWKVPTLRLTAKTTSNNVRVVIYRWSLAQQNYYQVTSLTAPVSNDTTVDSISFVDTLNDAEILGNQLIYTTGGVVENIAAPACNAMTLYKSRLILLSAEDNSWWYSKQVLSTTPVEMSDLFTSFIAPTIGTSGSTGLLEALFPMDDKLIFFKKDAPYYITGNGPDNTGANNDFSEPTFITSSVGCANQGSISLVPAGLMFQSDKGRWLLSRGLDAQYLGAPVEIFNSATDLSALTIPGTNQLRITLDSGKTLMYDYFYNQWGTFTGIPSISSCLYMGYHTFLNKFGQVFQETPGVYLDGSSPVLMRFTTGWLAMAGLQGFERAYHFYFLGQFITPHILQLQIAYDYDASIIQNSVYYPNNFVGPYGSDSLFGSSSPYGGGTSREQGRVFLVREKCQSFQITLNEFFDATYGTIPGAGFTMSGLNLVVGQKSSYPRLDASRSVS